MSTYKIGNKVQGIIRAYAPGKIGEMTMEYKNQPYAIIRDIEASLSFSSDSKVSTTSDRTELAYNHDTLYQANLNSVLMNDKILDLVYKENKDKLFSRQETYMSDNTGKIYFNFPTEEVYQVFIYDNTGKLEKAYGTFSDYSIEVEKEEAEYSVYYSFLGEKSYKLSKPENYYVTLDLMITGNKDDGTQDMCVHIEKCLISVNKSMYFNTSNSNTVDLIAKVIHTDEDYITVK